MEQYSIYLDGVSAFVVDENGQPLPSDTYIIKCSANDFSNDEPALKNITVNPGNNLVIAKVMGNEIYGVVSCETEMKVDLGLSNLFVVGIPQSCVYTGHEIDPEIHVMVSSSTHSNLLEIPSSISVQNIAYEMPDIAWLVSKRYDEYLCYSYELHNNLCVGTASALLSAPSTSTSLCKKFSILPANLSIPEISIQNAPLSVEYTGNTSTEISNVYLEYNEHRLVLGIDYQQECLSNDALGIATLSCGGINNFTGHKEHRYSILGNLQDASIYDSQNGMLVDECQYAYTGYNIEPSLCVMLHSKQLSNNNDYNVVYATEDFSWPGRKYGAIQAHLSSYCINHKDFSYEITAYLSSCNFNDVPVMYKMIGEEIKPSLQLSIGSHALANGHDYVIDYISEDYVHRGSKTIQFVGQNGFKGIKDFNYVIYDDTQTQVFMNGNRIVIVDAVDGVISRDMISSAISSAFDRASMDDISKVVIGTSVSMLGNRLFAGLSALEDVDMHLCTIDLEIPEGCFEDCTSLTAVQFPGSIINANS